MSKSLSEQLLNKGLVDSKKAKSISKQKQQALKEQHRKKKSAQPAQSRTARESEQRRQQQRERDRQLNLERKEQADRKALMAQILQLVEQYKLDRNAAEIEYNFNDQNIVKKILVTKGMSIELSRGRLCIVRIGNAYEVVPKPIADKIRQRDENSIVVFNQNQQQTTEKDENDDYYAQFEIPDDLVW